MGALAESERDCVNRPIELCFASMHFMPFFGGAALRYLRYMPGLRQRGIRTTEVIEILRKYWAGGRFDYQGRILQLEDVDMLPLPVQPGGPPIWVSGRSEGAMRRAATLGDGWNHVPVETRAHRRSFRDNRMPFDIRHKAHGNA